MAYVNQEDRVTTPAPSTNPYSNPEAKMAPSSGYSAPDMQGSTQGMATLSPYSMQPGATPTRFWKWCNESDFYVDRNAVNEGNFGKVVRGRFKEISALREKHRNFAGIEVALKYPKENSTFFMEFHKLSHEISCTVIHHPAIVNYMGGLNVTNPRRVDPDGVGVVMEYCETDLRRAIENPAKYTILTQEKHRYRIAKEIASGMMFLHSQKPHVLHRDLRCPNVLLTKDWSCRIADFGISTNMGYTDMKHTELYQDLAPPECRRGEEYTKKSDVYFYGWLLVELFIGQKPVTGSSEWKERLNERERKWILSLIDDNQNRRPDWDDMIRELNPLIDTAYDLELLAKQPDEAGIKSFVDSKSWNYVKEQADAFGRNLYHQCCIFGNLAGLRYLVSVGGSEAVHKKDNFGLTCAHLAARNGHLDILKYLDQFKVNFDEMDKRFDTTPLTLAIAMKHFDCVKFLGTHVTQQSLDAGLISAASEGAVEVVENLLKIGADMKTVDPDLKKTPLMWASSNGHPNAVEVLLKYGADVNYARPKDNVTAVYQAAEKGQERCVELLMQHGADINTKRSDDSTPFWQACWKGHHHVVRFLIQKNANIHEPKRRTSPLQIAISQGHTPIVALLLESGYKINESSRPYLYDACIKGHKDMVAMMIARGADVQAAITFAEANGTAEPLKEILKKVGAL